ETVPRQMSEKDILGGRVVEHSPSAADDGLSLASQVIRKCNARGKVVVVLIVELADLVGVSRSRVEAVEQVILLTHDAKIVPAQSHVQRQARSPAKAVLKIPAVVVLEGVAHCVAAT